MGSAGTGAPAGATAVTAPTAAPSPVQLAGAEVTRLLAAMTVEQQVGQVMMVSFDGTTFTPEAQQMVRDYHVGGLILFQQNLRESAQVRALTGQLQTAARVPLLVGADQ